MRMSNQVVEDATCHTQIFLRNVFYSAFVSTKVLLGKMCTNVFVAYECIVL